MKLASEQLIPKVIFSPGKLLCHLASAQQNLPVGAADPLLKLASEQLIPKVIFSPGKLLCHLASAQQNLPHVLKLASEQLIPKVVQLLAAGNAASQNANEGNQNNEQGRSVS